MLIVAETKVSEVLKQHPELKDVLIGLNPKFKLLDNPAVFRTLGRIARMKDVARVGNMSICELLYPLNEALGQLDAMAAICPECLEEEDPKPLDEAMVTVPSKPEANGEEWVVESSAEALAAWWDERSGYQQYDLTGLDEDPFHFIMEKASPLDVGQGFGIIQEFRPEPLLNVLSTMGFEFVVERRGADRYRVWFHRLRKPAQRKAASDHRVGLVLQSATPVVWPILARMMASERLTSKVRFDEIKVWDKTEQHLAWLLKGRADVTFSAVVAATRFYARGVDIKMASVDVWDNFFILSRSKPVRSLADLAGRTLRVPLIKNAPPFAVLSYLLKAEGMDPAKLAFAFGEPFGRAEEIAEGFVAGRYDTVMLREPEASIALAGAGQAAFEPLSFRTLWEKLHGPGTMLPNAGLVFKGAFLHKHPEEARLFMEELESAMEWVRTHPQEAAALAEEHMRLDKKAADLFVSRVTFFHVPAAAAKDQVARYLQVLVDEGGMRLKGATMEKALEIFDIPESIFPKEATSMEEKIVEAINKVEHPEIAMSLVDLGMVRDVAVNDEGHVTMALVIPFMGIPDVIKNFMSNSLVQAVRRAGGEVDEIRVEVMTDEERQMFFQREQANWRA